jgi:hypothetical protein
MSPVIESFISTEL